MILSITVRPNSKKPGIEQIDEHSYRIALRAAARDGKANEELIEVLSAHFDVAKSLIFIKTGVNSPKKLVEIRR